MNISSLFGRKKSSGRYVPDRSGFKELTDEIPGGSINAITEHLGYHLDQVYTYHGDFDENFDVTFVIVEIFTRNIVFVITKDSVTNLDRKKVDFFLRKFEISEVFDSITTRNILEEGIANRSLRIEYLSRVLNIQNPDPNGIFYIDTIGLYLYFIDGYLVSFQSSDGLNEWAKYFKQANPALFKLYEKTAKLFWGNKVANIINEINIQADSWAKIPDGFRNEYITLHETKFGTINFAMLRLSHYGMDITLNQFLDLNRGRCKKIDENTYQVDRFIYEFFDDGSFSNSYLGG